MINYQTTGNPLWPYNDEPDNYCDCCGKAEYTELLTWHNNFRMCSDCLDEVLNNG